LFFPRRREAGYVLPQMSDEVKVTAVKALLPAGPASNGGFREHELLQFYADMGGLRTIRTDCIVDVR
jgi:hypothetical protein